MLERSGMEMRKSSQEEAKKSLEIFRGKNALKTVIDRWRPMAPFIMHREVFL